MKSNLQFIQTKTRLRGIRIPLFLAACLIAALPAATAVADPPGGVITPPASYPVVTMSALWTETAPATEVFLADNLADLQSEMTDQALVGKRLAAFESWLGAGGVRRYAGLFRSATSSPVLVTGLTELSFEAERLIQAAAGRRLIDLEVERVGSSRVYSGLFSASAWHQEVAYGLDATDFAAEIAYLDPFYRLIAFDTWWESGEQKISGVFQFQGNDVRVALGLAWNDFLIEMTSQNGDGYQLIDIEITEVPGGHQNLYSGRWRPMAFQLDWLGVGYLEAWLEPAHALISQGFEFSGIEEEPDPLDEPTVAPKNLLDLEVNRTLWDETPNHIKPIHDCGTPGPPKPTC